MADAGHRVALLARPGVAAERLRAAVGEAGALLVLDIDPTVADVSLLLEAAPQTVVVLLDAAVEEVVDRFDAVLADPAVDVLYEEAELAAAREGWEAARWTRHLVAKLLRHDDVLPPGREPDHDADLDLQPGRPPTPSQLSEGAQFSTHADEALALAGQIPASMRFDPVAAEYEPGDGSEDGTGFALELPGEALAASGEEAADPEAGTQLPPEHASADPVPDNEREVHTFTDPALAPDTESATLASDDESQDSPESSRRFQHDLADIERRIASMELVDAPAHKAPVAASAGAAQGAVVVFAGIGGPDAVRQFLGELPKGFPRPVLVHQRLDGGRYDRLVQQMVRATSLPVDLAQDGGTALPGHVYILPPDLGVAPQDDGLHFAAGGQLIAALQPTDSAILMFSGSDVGLVDAAMNHAWGGALVAGQSPDGCYDAEAPGALVARGGESGQPAELARRLARRWPT